MIKNKKAISFITEFFLSLPSFLWLTVFFVIPTVFLIILAYKSSALLNLHDSVDSTGGLYTGFQELLSGSFTTVIYRTIWISIVSTAVCIIIAVPVGYCMAQLPSYLSNIFVFLMIIPFWTNFLIRVFAWKIFLSPDNFLFKLLLLFGIVSEDTLLLHNNIAVITVIVYTSLPFVIFAIYSAAEKFNFRLIEASHDLGANRLESFLYIFIPNIASGIKSGIILALIPCLGSYVIPELVGGVNSIMVGNVVVNQIFVNKNIPLASFWLCTLISVTVIIAVLISLFILVLKIIRRRRSFKI